MRLLRYPECRLSNRSRLPERSGSDQVSNLALACPACNRSKNPGRHQCAREHAPSAQWDATRIERIQRDMKAQFKDAAIMHATRWRLSHQLQATGLPLEGGSGGCIKTQRIQHQLPKEHYYDALCVGTSTPKTFTVMPAYVAVWSAKGRGSRQPLPILSRSPARKWLADYPRAREYSTEGRKRRSSPLRSWISEGGYYARPERRALRAAPI